MNIELTNTQIQKIITLFNLISQNSIESISTENPSISSGIAIRMKDRSEVRIQYDKKNIYVTRSEVQYIIEDNELKEIFDKELKKNNNNI